MLRLDGSPVDAEVVSVLTNWGNGKPAYQVIFRDLTMLKAAEATLRYQAALVTHATDAIIATMFAGLVTSWNPAAEAIYQRSAARALTVPITEAVGAAVDPAAIVAAGGVEQATHRAADGTASSPCEWPPLPWTTATSWCARTILLCAAPNGACGPSVDSLRRGSHRARRAWSARVDQSRRPPHPRLAP